MDVAQEPRAGLGRSAHADTFCRDSLPPADQWPDLLFRLPELAYPDRLNCADALLTGPDGDRRCLVWPGGTWTYRQLREQVDAIAHVLVEDLGLITGNRVLLRGPNSPWLVACWLAVVKAGGVTVATMPMLRPGELHSIGAVTRPAFAVCDDRFIDDLAAGRPDLRIVSYSELESSAGRHRTPFPAVATSADDVALLAVTSGTTGVPKTTAHFHRDVLAVADTFSRHVLRPTADDLFVGSPPLAFTFGLGALLIFPFRAGAASLLLERATPDLLADAIAEHGATALFTAPTAYRAMVPIVSSSAGRSIGIVATATPPALTTPNQQASSHGAFGPRISTRSPGSSPSSSTSTPAIPSARSRSCPYDHSPPGQTRQRRSGPRSAMVPSSSASAQLSRAG